ncbi:MAG: DUF373 family protein [Nitrosopumilaceae archaeon]
MSLKDIKLERKTGDTSFTNRLLVICIDRDDDIGKKAHVEAPVVGRDACIEAAQKLALEDPEDADSNSIFATIKTYEDLVSRGYQAEVIVVAGDENRGVRADEKIISQIKEVKEKFAASGAVIVSDGQDDESVIPIIQNVLPVVSVQRVVMRVSKGVEYSYAVLGKYLKMIAYDPKFSKFFLGVPGILLLIGGIATIAGLTTEIFAILVGVLGGALLIRAFDIDKAWSSWSKPTPAGFIRLFTMVTGLILVLASIPTGLSALDTGLIPEDINVFGIITDKEIVGLFIAGMLPFLWMGIGTIFAGSLLSHWLKGSLRLVTEVIRIIVLVSLYPMVLQFTNVLVYDESPFTLLPPLAVGLAVTLISATILFRRYRKKRGGEVLTE